MEKAPYFEKAIAWAEKRSITELKASLDGYEAPKSFKNTSTNIQVQPDLSFQKGDTIHYSDIALKVDNVNQLVTRWKLLSFMATTKKGQLHLLTPKGHKMFTKKLVDNYKIDAQIHPI